MDVPLGSVGVAAATRTQALDKLAPYQAALDLPIARLVADLYLTSLYTTAAAAAP
jgi:hypothetical protein